MNGIRDALILREALASTRMALASGQRTLPDLSDLYHNKGECPIHDGEHVAELTGSTSYYKALPTPEELTEWMIQVEMSPVTLAERLEVHVKYVEEILRGETDPPVHTWFAIGKIVGMKNQEKSVIAQSNYAVAPGEWVQEWLDDTDTSADTLAFKLGVAPSYVNQILTGEVAISDALASALAEVTGIRESSWQAWETLYQRDKRRIAGEKRVAEEKLLAARRRGTPIKAERRDELLGEIVQDDQALPDRLGPDQAERVRAGLEAAKDGTFEGVPFDHER